MKNLSRTNSLAYFEQPLGTKGKCFSIDISRVWRKKDFDWKNNILHLICQTEPIYQMLAKYYKK